MLKFACKRLQRFLKVFWKKPLDSENTAGNPVEKNVQDDSNPRRDTRRRSATSFSASAAWLGIPLNAGVSLEPGYLGYVDLLTLTDHLCLFVKKVSRTF